MASFGKPPPPGWYYLVLLLLAAWNTIGCYFCYLQITLGADWMKDATDYDRALLASMPGWYNICYAVAVGTGLLGALAMMARSSVARSLLAASLVAVVAQFGYLFATSDIIAHKGFMTVVPFPVVVAAISAGALWFARFATRRRWIG